MHCKSRLKRFLKMLCYQTDEEFAEKPNASRYDDIDVRNAMKYFCKNEDWTGGDKVGDFR